MTKKELINFLEPFTDDIVIYLKDDGDNVIMPRLRYEMDTDGIGVVTILGDD
jgi:hypothetical protein